MNETDKLTDLERMQKVQAAELLLKLTDYDYQTQYRSGDVYIFDSSGFRIKLKASERLSAKVKELRDKYGYEVYAITYERTSFGDCYSFLIVPKHSEDWDMLIFPTNTDTKSVYAYVWNVTHEECSESGYIAVKYDGLLLRRVG